MMLHNADIIAFAKAHGVRQGEIAGRLKLHISDFRQFMSEELPDSTKERIEQLILEIQERHEMNETQYYQNYQTVRGQY